MGFTRAELEAFRDATVPDLVGPGLRLLFVGINPGLWTAATATHFAHPGNRFYPALRRGQESSIGTSTGAPGSRTTTAATSSTAASASPTSWRGRRRGHPNSTPAELLAGGPRLRQFVDEHQPRVVAVAGVSAYRQAFAAPKATLGPQPDGLGDAELWVVPNPSGLNAHETIDSLAAAYRAPAVAAGVVDRDSEET